MGARITSTLVLSSLLQVEERHQFPDLAELGVAHLHRGEEKVGPRTLHWTPERDLSPAGGSRSRRSSWAPTVAWFGATYSTFGTDEGCMVLTDRYGRAMVASLEGLVWVRQEDTMGVSMLYYGDKNLE
ncbi:hypothetical protein NDU88_007326 [Pleurodeles waltl]|uniref:Uncharacterized protein n=1 Tax=Pleurodeles waltl TaxID=8319 RepID=A0AAV7WF36_PLEWA|nr:hypothetical protein NDU88_007326 [Pleurodeles waltl]